MTIVVCVHAPLGADERAALARAVGAAGSSQVVALAAGGPAEDAALAEALASGAGRAVRLDGEALAASDFHTLGRALAAAVLHLRAELVLCGAHSGDEALGAVGGALAEHRNAAYLACIDSLALTDGSLVRASVRSGGRRRHLEVRTPAVLTVAAGLLPSTASSAPAPRPAVAGAATAIEVLTLGAVGLDPGLLRRRDDLLGERVATTRPQRAVDGAAALLAALQD